MQISIFQEGNRRAVFNADRSHRYQLMRVWDEKKILLYIMLNPSTANENTDDRTIQSCRRIAESNGYGGFIVVNLFSFVTKDVDILKQNLSQAIDKFTDHFIEDALVSSSDVVFAWGNWNFTKERSEIVKKIVQSMGHNEPLCIHQNKNGSPRHPLFIKGDVKLQKVIPS